MSVQITHRRIKQVKFYCEEDLYSRLASEKIKRGTSLEKLLVEAVENFLKQPESKKGRKRTKHSGEREPETIGEGTNVEFLLTNEEVHWVEMWIEFMRELPPETVNASQQMIQDFIRFFRSARLKAHRVRPSSTTGLGNQEQD